MLVICTILSFCVLFLYAAQITGKLSNEDLADEQSTTYRVFALCLKREKDRYQEEKDARYALLKKDSDDEGDQENVIKSILDSDPEESDSIFTEYRETDEEDEALEFEEGKKRREMLYAENRTASTMSTS